MEVCHEERLHPPSMDLSLLHLQHSVQLYQTCLPFALLSLSQFVSTLCTPLSLSQFVSARHT